MNTRQNSLQSLGQLLRSWWKVDRIRIASPTGRLMRLAPGDRVLIGERLFLVRTRSVASRPGEAGADLRSPLTVEYRLINLSEHAGDNQAGQSDKVVVDSEPRVRLQIQLPNDGQPSVLQLWIRGRVEELEEEEVVVF